MLKLLPLKLLHAWRLASPPGAGRAELEFMQFRLRRAGYEVNVSDGAWCVRFAGNYVDGEPIAQSDTGEFTLHSVDAQRVLLMRGRSRTEVMGVECDTTTTFVVGKKSISALLGGGKFPETNKILAQEIGAGHATEFDPAKLATLFSVFGEMNFERVCVVVGGDRMWLSATGMEAILLPMV